MDRPELLIEISRVRGGNPSRRPQAEIGRGVIDGHLSDRSQDG